MTSTLPAPREILIVEDETETAEFISLTLESAGYTPVVAADGTAALRAFQEREPQLMLLDVRLPDIDGLEVLRQVRQLSSGLPLIMMSGYTGNGDTVSAFELGADDFLAKPFAIEELLARIYALLRRVERMSPQTEARLSVRQLELDTSKRLATLRGRKLHLTTIEYALLLALMRQAGRIVSHDELLDAVWGSAPERNYSVLRVNVSRLRQKLEENPRHPTYIVTVPGEGYTLPPR